MKTVKIFDTTLRDGEQAPGYSTPDEYAALIASLVNRVKGIDRAVLLTHCSPRP